jgi:predicted component of type VI protein secretion system
MASITIYVPDQEPIELVLDGYEQVSIGRGPDNDIVLDHVSMSGSHAIIYNTGGMYQVQDLGSTNGTFLNGEAISEGALGNGSRVSFGSVEAIFQDESQADASDSFAASSGGSGYASGHVAEIAEVSNRPVDFKDLSPIEKVVKKNTFGQIAMILGVVAILAAVALVVLSVMMEGA